MGHLSIWLELGRYKAQSLFIEVISTEENSVQLDDSGLSHAVVSEAKSIMGLGSMLQHPGESLGKGADKYKANISNSKIGNRILKEVLFFIN
ncbi:hypothetical protein V6Z05_10315 [Leptospira venezuelensis]|uniref:hypothetical protein n=1 Tax=Leptospira venezuelensis TaxID=1958811 RepID=UPI0030061A8C